jgi:hypothetical protein
LYKNFPTRFFLPQNADVDGALQIEIREELGASTRES